MGEGFGGRGEEEGVGVGDGADCDDCVVGRWVGGWGREGDE